MAKKDRVVATKLTVNLPFGIGSLELEADETERRAAWALYVQLVTRVAVQPLDEEHGLLREALNSLYALFEITRDVLITAGPDVGASPDSVGGIAIAVLNRGLRPFLSKWHPQLQSWEKDRPSHFTPQQHEQGWPHAVTMRNELEQVRQGLEQYAHALAKIVGVEM